MGTDEGNNVMQERESSRNGDPQDRNWQEQGEKNGKGVDGEKVRGNGAGYG